MELLHFSHFHHILVVWWTNCLLPAKESSSSRLGGATHTSELGLIVSTVLLRKGISYHFEKTKEKLKFKT